MTLLFMWVQIFHSGRPVSYIPLLTFTLILLLFSRISLVAPRTTVSPHILNSGEFFLSDGLEHFVSGTQT